jgi:hypothetical protein
MRRFCRKQCPCRAPLAKIGSLLESETFSPHLFESTYLSLESLLILRGRLVQPHYWKHRGRKYGIWPDRNKLTVDGIGRHAGEGGGCLPQVSSRASDDIQVDGLRNEAGEEVKFLAVGTVHARQAFE